MGGIDQTRKSIVLEKVLGLVSKRKISEVAETLWGERKNKSERLYMIYIPVTAKWFELRKK